MKPNAVAAATACILTIAPLAAAPALAQDQAAGARDLQAIHDQLRDNSPEAVVDQDSATFRKWLDDGLQKSLALTGRIDTPNAYGYVLKGYSGGFRDSSIDARPNWVPLPRSFAVDWPGFSTSWRDGGYYVAYVQPNLRGLPPVGAKLVACDGTPAEQVARQRLDRYEGNLDLEADRVKTAPWLFWNRGNPLIGGHPLTCDFQNANGRGKRSINLVYTTSPEADREAAYRAAAPVSDDKLAIEAWGANRYWVSVHTMAEGPNYEAFLKQVEGQVDALRNADVVVIDLRGAGDGDGASAYRIANRLWDPEFVKQHRPPSNNVVFRVSQGNRDYFAGIAARLRGDPAYSTDRAIWDEEHTAEAVVAGFDAAIAAKQTTFVFTPPSFDEQPAQPAAAAPGGAAPAAGAAAPAAGAAAPAAAPAVPPPPPPPATNPVRGKVYILTDYACVGGCLDLLDVASRLPNVAQAGNTTGTDTIFVEPETIILGNARLTFPLRAWLDRPRASNVAYTPAPNLTWTGAYNDEQGYKAWIDKAVSGGAATPAPAAH
jgi:hypothetical protein